MKMGKMKILRFLIAAMILLSIGTSVQAFTISGDSYRVLEGEVGDGINITYTSDDTNTLLTTVVIDISTASESTVWFESFCTLLGCVDEPEVGYTGNSISADGKQLTVTFNDFNPDETATMHLDIDRLGPLGQTWGAASGADLAGSTVSATFTGSECTFSGTYVDTGGFTNYADFGGTCPPAPVLSLAPVSDTNLVGSPHVLTARLVDATGAGIANKIITFTVTAGPHVGTTGWDLTDPEGDVAWGYVGTTAGKDTIVATGAGKTSNEAFKTWEAAPAELCPDKYRWGSYNWDPFPFTFVGRQEVHFVNKGTVDAYAVTATVTCVPINVVATDPDVTLGDIPAGGGAWSTDTFELRVDMTNPQGPNKGICWRVEYDDAAGVHHTIEDIAKFCGEQCSDICP